MSYATAWAPAVPLGMLLGLLVAPLIPSAGSCPLTPRAPGNGSRDDEVETGR